MAKVHVYKMDSFDVETSTWISRTICGLKLSSSRTTIDATEVTEANDLQRKGALCKRCDYIGFVSRDANGRPLAIFG